MLEENTNSMEDITGSAVHEAAREGNVEYLIESLATHPTEYFLTRSKVADDSEDEYNIIHAAIRAGQAEFLKQTLERLPTPDVMFLLCQEVVSSSGYNAFHLAVARGNLTIVKVLVEFSTSSLSSSPSASASASISSAKPWLTLDQHGKTPFFMALDLGMEECALELMSLDMELLCDMADNEGISSVVQAVRGGFSKVALKILTSGHPYSIRADTELSPLHVAPNCSEDVCKLLLDKHPRVVLEADTKFGGRKTIFGISLLHKWVSIGKVWPFKLLLNWSINFGWRRQIVGLLDLRDWTTGNSVFHLAACHCSQETLQITQLLIEAYQEEKGHVLSTTKPWRTTNFIKRHTPLLTALIHKHEKLALYYLSVDFEHLVIRSTNSVLYAAVWNGCDEVAQAILAMIDPSILHPILLKSDEGKNVLHVASNCTETTASLLVEKLPWLIKEHDDYKKTPLDVASELGTAWLIKLLLTKESSSYKESAWIEACNRGHVPAIEAFIKYSPDFRTLCIEARDSPLHHIKMGSYNQYQEFLAIPLIQEMINMPDFNSSTPLHRALERKDIILAEILLSTDGVSRTIHDKKGNTATSLLIELCNQDNAWETMCQRIGINLWLRTNYIQPNNIGVGASIPRASTTSPTEMRGILSVVAALLATLTFAAGFTLPGGLNQDTGEALLAKKASFLVFILADTYAMCCSMLVLFFLMWSMIINDQNRGLILVDRSVLILIQSLYGTLLAFMTGVFTVISHKSLWASIVIFVMCSLVALVAVSANRVFLYKILDKLAPSSATRKRRNHTRSLEKGIPLTSKVEETVRNQSDDPPSTV